MPAARGARPDHSGVDEKMAPPAAPRVSSSSTGRSGGSGAGRTSGGAGRYGRSLKGVSVPELVLQLCKTILKKDRDEEILGYFHHALRIFNAQVPNNGGDFSTSQKIQRRLVQIDRVEDAASFARLHGRLQGSSVVRRHDAIVNFFWFVSEYNAVASPAAPLLSLATSIVTPPFTSSTPHPAALKGGPRPYVGPWGDQTTPQLVNLSQVDSSGISSIRPPTSGFTSQSSRLTSGLTQHTLPSSHQKGTSAGPPHSSITLTGRAGPLLPVPETSLVREVVYSLQGIDGAFLKFDSARDVWVVDEEAALGRVNKSKRLYMLRFAELGWLHNKIRQYVGGKGNERAYGLVGQSYLAALNQELTEYYRLVGVLESKLHQDEEAITNGEPSSEALTLRRLQVWLAEPLMRLKAIAAMVDACKGQKGGALASSVHAHMQTGNPYLRSIVENVLCWIALPIHSQLMAWIFDGELDDAFHEFFVASDPQVKADRLWHDKYTLRRSMVPSFISTEQANKILLSGKSINFLRQLCQDNAITDGATPGAIPGCPARPVVSADAAGVPGKSSTLQPVQCMYEQDILGQFQKLIDASYTSTNKYLLEVLHQRYQFMDHLMGMRRYLLLGQGDFIRHLMDLLADDLEKPANLLYMHNLTGTLEAAIRATNAQYDNPEILKRLDVRLLQVSPGDAGWDVFCLDYHVNPPISTVFTQESLLTYLRVFNFLWRAKRMEYILSSIWSNQMADSRRLLRSRGPVLTEMSYVIHLCQVITTEMVHFIGQLQYYITFEVLECSWDVLLKKVKAAGDMDQLISAHEEFLDTIIARSLLDPKSETILSQLRLLLDQITKFQTIQNELFTRALEEQNRRWRLEGRKTARTQEGKWGGGEEEEYTEVARRQAFQKNTVSAYKSKLMILYQTYQDMVNKFLLMLNSHSDDNLKFLSFRLDFNEYYKGKEPKLRTSLCFQSPYRRHPTAGPATSGCAAAASASPPVAPQHPQLQAAQHHASMDRIHAVAPDKRHQGLSSL